MELYDGKKLYAWVSLTEGDHSEDVDIDGRIILKVSYRSKVLMVWTGLIWLRIGTRDLVNIVTNLQLP